MKSRTLVSSTPTHTSIPARRMMAMPAPSLRASGSSVPTKTARMPDATIARAQDGVRPTNAHGSSVTKRVSASVLRLVPRASRAAASACGVPGAPVNPRATTTPPATMTQPTGGLGRHAGSACLLSSSASVMKWRCSASLSAGSADMSRSFIGSRIVPRRVHCCPCGCERVRAAGGYRVAP